MIILDTNEAHLIAKLIAAGLNVGSNMAAAGAPSPFTAEELEDGEAIFEELEEHLLDEVGPDYLAQEA